MPKKGSPPPMRGKEFAQFMKSEYHRITPAYAGKSEFLSLLIPYVPGSPPPMRGKGRFLCTEHPPSRITPAYAGKRSASCGRVEAVRDHPRLCGEKLHGKQTAVCGTGSPPPMRGKALKCPLVRAYSRITPAYAGKRWTPLFRC